MAVIGVVAGGLFGLALTFIAAGYVPQMKMPGAIPVIGSAAILLIAAVVASLLPARRAARVDVIQALRGE
jgi:ABC-type antimicrobial peptide transport system permease subunit